MRHEIGSTLIQVISMISTAMDKAPSISKKREQESLKGKLKATYTELIRTGSRFPRTGPRLNPLHSPDHVTPPITSHSAQNSSSGNLSGDGGFQQKAQQSSPLAQPSVLFNQHRPDLQAAASDWHDEWDFEEEEEDFGGHDREVSSVDTNLHDPINIGDEGDDIVQKPTTATQADKILVPLVPLKEPSELFRADSFHKLVQETPEKSKKTRGLSGEFEDFNMEEAFRLRAKGVSKNTAISSLLGPSQKTTAKQASTTDIAVSLFSLLF